MLNTSIITILTTTGKSEIFISPLLLQSKEVPDFSSGKLSKLYFYADLEDDEYRANLKQETSVFASEPNCYIINYGQNFAKYYLGSFNVDFETKRYWQWEAGTVPFTAEDVQTLGLRIFDFSEVNSRRVTLVTPTRPSDIASGRLIYPI